MPAMLAASPQQSFQPRKEFVKRHSTAHQFALVTFNGQDILRLSSFPPPVISSLNKLFHDIDVYRFYREDAELQVSEFVLADRMWSGKSSRAERLITQIFTVLLSHHFRYVTTLAYGRLPQDRQSLVFSRALPASSNHNLLPPQFPSGSGSTPGGSPRSANFPMSPQNLSLPPGSPMSPSSPGAGRSTPQPSIKGSPDEIIPPLPLDFSKTTFALSLSQKKLRVIHAPRTSTPAILATVRSAWPRGVVSEGKTDDEVYEFVLKGYGFFSSSTFERDALAHIFSLLRSLDSHSFNLITNLSLSSGMSKSRTKDIWIFEAPADQPSDDWRDSTSGASDAGIAGIGAPGSSSSGSSPSPLGHGRSATDPEKEKEKEKERTHKHSRNASTPNPAPPYNANGKSFGLGRAGSLLKNKKTPPSAFADQEPVAVTRKASKSSISSVERRHDKGAARVTFQSDSDVQGPLSPSQYDIDYNNTYGGPGATDSAHMYRPYSGQPVVVYDSQHRQQQQSHMRESEDVSQILHGNAFRDTAFSDVSQDVPINYTGETRRSKPRTESEMYEREYGEAAQQHSSGGVPRTGRAVESTHVEDNVGRVSNWRKSEKGVVGVLEADDRRTRGQPRMDMPAPVHSPHHQHSASQTRDPMVMAMPIPQVQSPSAVPTLIPVRGDTTGISIPEHHLPERMQSSASILPPGAFPRTPPALAGFTSSPLATAAPATPNVKKGPDDPIPLVASAPSTPKMGGSTSRISGGSPGGGGGGGGESSGKGWVLVNVESSPPPPAGPSSQKQQPPQREGSGTFDLRSPPMSPTSPTSASAAGGGATRRKGSLKKKTRKRTSVGSAKELGVVGVPGPTSGRGLFGGLFGSKNAKRRKAAAASTNRKGNATTTEEVMDSTEGEDEEEIPQVRTGNM